MADWKKMFDDAVEQIGEAAVAAGEGLRQAADEAGKVVGIGVGSIELRPDGGTSYRLGEWITGMVALQLTEPIPAKGLAVTLCATRKRRVVVQDQRRGAGPRTAMRDEVIYEFVGEIGGEQTYESGEYYFSVELPPEIESNVEVGGLLGDALRAARAVKSMTERPLRWRLSATLEIPWKRNLSKAIDLSVREESVGPTPEPPRRESRRAESKERASAGAGGSPPDDAGRREAAGQRDAAARREAAQREAAARREAAEREAAARRAAVERDAAAKRRAAQGGGSTATSSGADSEPKRRRKQPVSVPPPISLPGGWGVALQRIMGQMLGQGWEVVHQWVPPPVDPSVVRDALGTHPDLDPEILMFYSMMDGMELVFGKPAASRPVYETVRLARAVAAEHGGSIGGLDELRSHPRLGESLRAEFSSERGGEVRVLEIPSLGRLLDDREDFMHRDGRCVVFGRVALGDGDAFGIVPSDEIRRWRAASSSPGGRQGYYDAHARSYQSRLAEREREHSARWWVVRSEDRGAALWEPPLLLRWSEMLALCLRHLETGEA